MKYISHQVSDSQIKYQFKFDDGKLLTWYDFINSLEQGGQELTESLKNANSQLKGAFFWECSPVSKITLNRTFEFMAIKSQELDNIKQDYSSFQEHIGKSTKTKIAFTSRSGETLIIPQPDEKKDYKNLASFIQNASLKQQSEFWREVARQLEANLADDKPRWLSTHGLGVSYLHVRIDKKPTYYSWDEYKNFRESDETTEKKPKKPTEPIFNNRETEKNPQKGRTKLDESTKDEMPKYNGGKKKVLEPENKKENTENKTNSEEHNQKDQKEIPWKIVLPLGAVLLGASLIIWWKMKQNKN